MEIELPKPTYGGIKKYIKRRRYQRLHGSATTGRGKMKVIRLRSPPRHRHYWRMGTIPKLRWMMRSPFRLMTKVKNAYMNFMLRLGVNVGALNTDNNISRGVKRILPKGRQGSKLYSGDAFEARLIFEISKSLVASHELYPM